jgi:hypothetical protein
MSTLAILLALVLGVQPAEKERAVAKPLTELGAAKYKGFAGGLYPDGKNDRPAAHEKAGRALAQRIQALDTKGKLSADGKIVLLSVGMSNTTQEFAAFTRLATADREINPQLILVDGAIGGMSARRIVMENQRRRGNYWVQVEQRLRRAGATRAQVQAAWLKEADDHPTAAFPKHAKTLQEELAQIVVQLHEQFPNLKVVYLSSRTYGGYARTPLNPEPYAYESGFAVKWLIEQQLQGDATLNYDAEKGKVRAPWLSWGPYLWADGTTKRGDGLFYEAGDFGGDGTHPSASGRRKVAEQLLRFFKTDSTTKEWFLGKN